MPGNRVCVLGAGPVGLAATKNLVEQGLQVTTFEKGDKIGGVWYPTDNKLSALPITSKNTSKQCSSFTDFPYPKDAATHPSAKQVEEFLNNYAKHFNILSNIHVSTEVLKVERDESKGEWLVSIKSTKAGSESPIQVMTFDRVVIASGMLNIPKMPKFKGSEVFEGDIIHSRDFKDPFKYEGKRVIVVGVGATGADTVSFLKRANAKKIYLSHRGQIILLPRMLEGKAFDHGMSRRVGMIMKTLTKYFPNGTMKLMLMPMTMARRKAFPDLDSHPSFNAPRPLDGMPHRIPVFSDDLAANLVSGIAEAVQGIAEISGPRSVTLTDGTVLNDIDDIIVCAGYGYDFSAVPGAGNPIDPQFAPDGYAAYKAARYYNESIPFPRLYQGFLSEQYPDSLSFLGCMLVQGPPFVVYDLVTMALASLWSGAYAPGLPSRAEMKRDIDTQYDIIVRLLDRGPIPYPGFRGQNGAESSAWLNKVAGTGVEAQVGNWSWAAWKLWWEDRKFYGLLMDGIDTPYIYRLFNTSYGRKAWAGARQQIIDTNKEVQEMAERWTNENRNKKAV
ncbi:flavin-binding monooxygenase-like-domain-containing protein [Xylariales sp. PMI_506]|nr:flavin-binding monooxygenase-like-domain-containing protein [Xylariales sp. PMI_506]